MFFSDTKIAKLFYITCSWLQNFLFLYIHLDGTILFPCLFESALIVDADRQLIILLSVMPFVAPDTKRLDVAIATSIVNNKLVDGSFDYDVTSGHMIFRMTSSFIESEIDSEVFTYMLMVSCHTIDEYNDKFFMLGKGMLSINQFLEEN